MKNKGFALLLFGIIIALGGFFYLGLAWIIGIVLGAIGLSMVFGDKNNNNNNNGG